MGSWTARCSHASSSQCKKPNRSPFSLPPKVPDTIASLASLHALFCDVWTLQRVDLLRRFVGPMTTSNERIHPDGPGRSWLGWNPVRLTERRGHLGTRKGETSIIDSPGRLLDNALTNEQLQTEAGRHAKAWSSWALHEWPVCPSPPKCCSGVGFDASARKGKREKSRCFCGWPSMVIPSRWLRDSAPADEYRARKGLICGRRANSQNQCFLQL